MPWNPRDEVRAKLEEWMISPMQVLSHLPNVEVREQGVKAIQGQGMVPAPPAEVPPGGAYLAHDGERVLVIATAEEGQGKAVVRFL